MVESDENYHSEKLKTDFDGDSNEDSNVMYPSFVMVKKMTTYKWVLGTRFSKEEFKNTIKSYAINNERDLRLIKNDSTRVRVECKDKCEWFV